MFCPTVAPSGLTCDSVGDGNAVDEIRNCTALLVPPAVVTVTLRVPGVAFDAIEKFAVAVVEPDEAAAVTVTPVPATVTAVKPDRFVPVSVTETDAPRDPLAGVI